MTGAREQQGDLFAGSGFAVEGKAPGGREPPATTWHALDDEALIAALPEASLADSLMIAAELGRRGSAAGVPALEGLCRRFAGFGLGRIVPEQAAALDALVAIGGGAAAEAVGRLLAGAIVQGPGLVKAVRAAAVLGASLPPEAVRSLLRHDDPDIRADACRCARRRISPETVDILLALLEDLHGSVRQAAASALGRMGRREALDLLAALLRTAPSAEVVEAVVPVADEACIVLLGRLARDGSALAPAVLDALDAIDDPLAEKIAAQLRDADRR